jgi:pimeloyl-ACP methyl ester carboxylesterase
LCVATTGAHSILVAPFTRVADVVTIHIPWIFGYMIGSYITFDNMELARKVRDLGQSVLIIHGTDDLIIPLKQGKRLCEEIGPKCQFIEAPDMGHFIELHRDLKNQVLSFIPV